MFIWVWGWVTIVAVYETLTKKRDTEVQKSSLSRHICAFTILFPINSFYIFRDSTPFTSFDSFLMCF